MSNSIEIIEKVLIDLKKCLKEGLSISKYSEKYGISPDKFYDFKRKTFPKLLSNESIPDDLKEEFETVYNECAKKNRYKNIITNDDNYESRCSSSEDRDEKNQIIGYSYEVLVRGKEPLIGYLTREEMDKIYRLYSYEGANLTQRSVSREFSKLSLQDFKRILRAFNITKDSPPLAPHNFEEKCLDVLLDETSKIKESNYFKKLEEFKIRTQEKRNLELYEENRQLKNKILGMSEWFSNFDFSNIKPFCKTNDTLNDNKTNKKSLILYLSDWHVGCYVSDKSLYNNDFNENVLNERLEKVFKQCCLLYKNEKTPFDEIIIVNLGDSLDGLNKQTTRGGHLLPQNMDNREQFDTFIKSTISFIGKIYESEICENVSYYCVGDSNHGGDFDYFANKAISMYLNIKYPPIKVEIFNKLIGHFSYGYHTFMVTHGKDSIDMFKGLPFILDEKTENFINQYIDYNGLVNKTLNFIKGDLHRTSVTFGRRFRYKNVSSILGSSKWIHSNFGNTKAAVDYEIVYKDDVTILEGRIILN